VSSVSHKRGVDAVLRQSDEVFRDQFGCHRRDLASIFRAEPEDDLVQCVGVERILRIGRKLISELVGEDPGDSEGA
jgi:hypothetical protein